jgi:hypothetical protein
LRVQLASVKGRIKQHMPKSVLSAVAFLCATFLAGCAQISTRTIPHIDLAGHKRIFVEHRLVDSFGVADEIARQLRDMGYDASSGAPTMMPGDTELIVSYDDMWTWDFNTYMIEFDVQVRSARSDKIVAMGHYFRPSMVFGHPPGDMIHELLVKLFKHA